MSSAKAKTPRASKQAPASNRFICVHGHFYQPPRENPWLETVELQESAAPYHDWNDRITAECYAPNGAARITNQQNEIVRIVNNYSRMSFNFGPTLLSWLADEAPRTYRMVIDADKASAQRYSGHGSAIAQVYNHMILPLANRRDSITQIRWGIADFESRFHRKPEGMWLAETAVSRKVLDLMAREGIKFTVLAPSQCARVRRLSEELAQPIRTFSYPVGSREAFNQATRDSLRRAGIQYAFSYYGGIRQFDDWDDLDIWRMPVESYMDLPFFECLATLPDQFG